MSDVQPKTPVGWSRLAQAKIEDLEKQNEHLKQQLLASNTIPDQVRIWMK